MTRLFIETLPPYSNVPEAGYTYNAFPDGLGVVAFLLPPRDLGAGEGGFPMVLERLLVGRGVDG